LKKEEEEGFLNDVIGPLGLSNESRYSLFQKKKKIMCKCWQNPLKPTKIDPTRPSLPREDQISCVKSWIRVQNWTNCAGKKKKKKNRDLDSLMMFQIGLTVRGESQV